MPKNSPENLEAILAKSLEEIEEKTFGVAFKAFMKKDWAEEDAATLMQHWKKIAELKQSKRTYQKQLLQFTQKILQEKSADLTHIDLENLAAQLKKETQSQYQLLRDSADFELLQATQKKIQRLRKLTSDYQIPHAAQPEHSLIKKYAPYAMILLIGFLGIFKGISDGFNGVNALLSLAGLAGTPIAIAIYAVFILTGVAVYITFDYNRICGVLGVPLLKVGGAIKKVYDECQLLEKMCEEITTLTFITPDKTNIDKEAFTEIKIYNQIIESHIQQLNQKREKLKETQPSYPVRMAGKIIMGVLGGSLFFSSGFFSGYSLAVGLFALTVSSGPAIAVGFVVAAAFLISYIALEGRESFRIVDGLAGTSEKLLNRITETSIKLTETVKNLSQHVEYLEQSFKGFPVTVASQYSSPTSPLTSPVSSVGVDEKIYDPNIFSSQSSSSPQNFQTEIQHLF